MVAKLHIPAYPLNKFIENFFYYSGFDAEHSVDRLLPDGNIHLIFDLTDTPKFIYDNESLHEIQSCKRVWFSGFRTEPITIPSGRESEMLIINFRMGAVYPFLKDPLNSTTNYVIDAELLLNNNILDLRDRIREAASVEAMFEIVESNFLHFYRCDLNENPFTNYAVTQIVANPSIISIKKIAEKVGYSQKHLIKIFRDHVGVTPKEFLKVIRFQRAIHEIESQRVINWSGIASDSGFYDQSHFIADFKKFSGYTPAEYLKQRGESLNYVPVR